MSSLAIQHGGNHYKGLAIQPAEFNQRNKLGFCESSAVKYVTRHGLKGGSQDLKKAIHFLQLALEFEYGITSKVNYSDETEGSSSGHDSINQPQGVERPADHADAN